MTEVEEAFNKHFHKSTLEIMEEYTGMKLRKDEDERRQV